MEFSIEIPLLNSTAATDLGARLAPLLRRGDVICLIGGLGAGKTTLARGLIQALIGPEEEAPSPTFTLVQTYDAPDFTIWHFDLYRLEGPEDVLELGWEDAVETGAVLVEWPDRLGSYYPEKRLEIALMARDEGRAATLNGSVDWTDRLKTLAP
ncbi:MAG: tRNA (adenosine(37)-N6)-threonylcarbamoyltransferase complex ATPase subunit type 1 TsaE [Pseudomonadota bacterium]